MYEYIDSHIKKYRDELQRLFNNSRLRLSAKYTEENLEKLTLAEVKALLRKLRKKDEDFFWLMLMSVFAVTENGELESILSGLEFDMAAFLASYNATVKYVYKNEIERKIARYGEGIISIGDPQNEETYNLMKTNIKNWARQGEEIAVDMERDVFVRQAKKDGITKIKWVAMGDEKTCKECSYLHGRVFDIDKVPQRPHHGCRCVLHRVEK